jgi:hypothetical protein
MRVVKREGLHGEAGALFVLTQQRMQTQKCRGKKQCKQKETLACKLQTTHTYMPLTTEKVKHTRKAKSDTQYTGAVSMT